MINSEYKNRRTSVISQIKDDSLLILFSASEKYRNNDVAYKYRQSSNFYYLTGINDPSTILMITKNGSNINTTLICKRPNDLDKVWHGGSELVDISKKLNIFSSTYALSFFKSIRPVKKP